MNAVSHFVSCRHPIWTSWTLRIWGTFSMYITASVGMIFSDISSPAGCYLRPVWAFGDFRCLYVWVRTSVRESTQVCLCDNMLPTQLTITKFGSASPVQARITKFGQEVQNTLVKSNKVCRTLTFSVKFNLKCQIFHLPIFTTRVNTLEKIHNNHDCLDCCMVTII